MPCSDGQSGHFDEDFRDAFEQLILWRRDVRRFRTDPIAEHVVGKLLDLAHHAPSVGNAQPWRFVHVASDTYRAKVIENFEAANLAAKDTYSGGKAAEYAKLKLAGLREAPVHLAVFNEVAPPEGARLGRLTMPETLAYSTVGAIHTLWLAARAYGIGLGWVSIVDPVRLKADLEVPENWQFIAYLCLGYPIEEHLDPELERSGWQSRSDLESRICER